MNRIIGKCPNCHRDVPAGYGGKECPWCHRFVPPGALEKTVEAGAAAPTPSDLVAPPGVMAATALRVFGATNGGLGIVAAIAIAANSGLGVVIAVTLLVESLFAWVVCYAVASVVENVLAIRMLLQDRANAAPPAADVV